MHVDEGRIGPRRAMNFTIDCECGRPVQVSEVQAGAHADCACGRRTVVPLLSELRRNAGLEAYQKSIAQRVEEQIAAGELPGGPQCAKCGMLTRRTFAAEARCEQSWRKTSGRLQVFPIPFVGIFWTWTERRVEDLGRETNVALVLRLCDDCRPGKGLAEASWALRWLKWVLVVVAVVETRLRWALFSAAFCAWIGQLVLRWLDQRRLKATFRRQAIYQELFAEFPDCTLARLDRRQTQDSSGTNAQ